ncbi:MAG TPA: hypothetical protein VK856_15900 [Anaerolineaceae bacterium]|nr:hypothetical protein [Anaerolineaceae bacterium]
MGDHPTLVLIASDNPIFRIGIVKLLSRRSDYPSLTIHQVKDIRDLIKKNSKLKPHLLIIDYDDKNINKKQFLDSFFEDQHDSQLLLVSLKESGNVVLYNRKVFSTHQAHQWLQIPWEESNLFNNSDKN